MKSTAQAADAVQRENAAAPAPDRRPDPVRRRVAAAGTPADPIAAVRQIGEDRVKALGNTNRAVFAVVDATLTQRGDVVRGALEATLELYSDANVSQGYVQARAERKHTGDVDDLRGTLYDMVATMKDDLNLELEHQIRSKMKSWLIEGVNATPEKVDSAPLTAPGRR